MSKKYIVTLSEEERAILTQLINSGTSSVRKINRARVLLKADAQWSDEEISQALDLSIPTIHRTRQAFVEGNIEAAINRQKSTLRRSQSLDGEQEAHLIALACGLPPAGRKRWTMQLLADKLVELGYSDTVSSETVRRTLKKTNLSLG